MHIDSNVKLDKCGKNAPLIWLVTKDWFKSQTGRSGSTTLLNENRHDARQCFVNQ